MLIAGRRVRSEKVRFYSSTQTLLSRIFFLRLRIGSLIIQLISLFDKKLQKQVVKEKMESDK